MTKTRTLRIDRIACTGHGQCAELLPELITLDEWGYPILHQAVIPTGIQTHARATVRACPRLALHTDSAATAAPPARPSHDRRKRRWQNPRAGST